METGVVMDTQDPVGAIGAQRIGELEVGCFFWGSD